MQDGTSQCDAWFAIVFTRTWLVIYQLDFCDEWMFFDLDGFHSFKVTTCRVLIRINHLWQTWHHFMYMCTCISLSFYVTLDVINLCGSSWYSIRSNKLWQKGNNSKQLKFAQGPRASVLLLSILSTTWPWECVRPLSKLLYERLILPVSVVYLRQIHLFFFFFILTLVCQSVLFAFNGFIGIFCSHTVVRLFPMVNSENVIQSGRSPFTDMFVLFDDK